MTVRIKEGVKDKTGGTGIEVTDNKVINLVLRDENNLIQVNSDNEVYTDLQLASGITPSSTFPVGITTGRALQANGRPVTGTVTINKTTSGDYTIYLYGDNGEVYVDNGTGEFNILGEKLYAGEGIEIKDGYNYYVRRGPCAEGFHVPDQSEVTLLYSTFTGIGLSASNFANYLKIPLAGYMDEHATVTDQGTGARIVTCTTRSNSDERCMYLYTTDSYVGPDYNLYKGHYGYSIRPFKDEPVTPDNTWTTIYSSGGKGIYHNATLGLISLSSDGSTWLTIADKNLGATTVFNIGDTLSEANAGKYYQRGNNYGFPGIGSSETITTSNTKVDTTGYGPENYYTSSIYITTGPDWSNPSNNNLWGGEETISYYNNAITNNGVLSVNGQTGHVKVQGAIVSATTPTEPEIGMLWYDTTNSKLNVYDGTQWNII